MTSVRADWHTDALDAAEMTSPLDAQWYSRAVVIDLSSATLDEMCVAMCDLLVREGRLDDRGYKCELKDQGTDCRTCQFASLSVEDPRSQLCRLGKDQFVLGAAISDAQTKQATRKTRELSAYGAQFEPLVALGHFAEQYMELAEALV